MEYIQTKHAPSAIGPYSQAVKARGFLYTSGQIALDPNTMTIVEGGIVEQTKQVFENLRGVLLAGGASRYNVVKATVFLKDMNDFSAVNEIYAEFFGDHKPARSCVEVARLPKDVLVEIELIAETE